MAGLVFFIPMLVIIAAYILLLRSLGNPTVEGNAGKSRQRAVVLIVTVLITFLVCFIPSNVMLVVHYTLLRNNLVNNGYGFYIMTLCLASLNSCFDPFIYYYVSDEFREHVKNALLCRSSRTVKRMRVSFSSMKYSQRTKTYTSSTGNTESSNCWEQMDMDYDGQEFMYIWNIYKSLLHIHALCSALDDTETVWEQIEVFMKTFSFRDLRKPQSWRRSLNRTISVSVACLKLGLVKPKQSHKQQAFQPECSVVIFNIVQVGFVKYLVWICQSVMGKKI